MTSFHDSLPSSHDNSFEGLPVSISDADLWRDPLPTKYEPVDDIVLYPGLVKDDNGFEALLATKASPEPLPWHSSQDLMGAVFGGSSTVAAFDVRLNHDIYLNANKKTAVNVFPVSHTSVCSVLANTIM